MCAANKKWEFLSNKMTIIDALTIIPVYIDSFGSSALSTRLNFFRAMRIFRALRILRIFKTLEAAQAEDDESGRLKYTVDTSGISKQLAITGVTIFSVLFIGAGIAHTLEELEPGSFFSNDIEFDFLSAIYYLIVTSVTIGYGDIYPMKTAARMVVIVIILVMVFIITNQISKIGQLMESYSKYDTQYNASGHIVIMGNYRPKALHRFLVQYYHTDHGNVKTKCIVIGEQYPSNELISIISDPRYEGKVDYLEGNPSSSGTLRKSNLILAESLFILTDQLDENQLSQDTYACLLAKMIQAQIPFIKSFVQLTRSIDMIRDEDYIP